MTATPSDVGVPTLLSPRKPVEDPETALLATMLGHEHHHRAAERAHIRIAGLISLAVLIIVWVVQAEASQAVQASTNFNKPFFIVGFYHTATVVLLPIVFVYFKLFGSNADRYETSWLDMVGMLRRHSVLPMPELMRISFVLGMLYCAADYFWYTALATVSVAAATAIFNCSPLFVYCFSICFLGESMSFRKILGVITAFAGVMLILVYQDSANRLDLSALESDSFVNGVFVVISAALYGGYEVAFKVVVGEELSDSTTVVILTGLSGLFTIPIWIVGSFVLAHSPIEALYEPLGWPETSEGLLMLCFGAFLAILYNLAMTLTILWTSPLETSVGCMLTIPLSGVFDSIVHHTRFSAKCILGSILVMAGFGALEYASATSGADSEDEAEERVTNSRDESTYRSRKEGASSSTSGSSSHQTTPSHQLYTTD